MIKIYVTNQPGRTPACRIGERDHAVLDTAKRLFLDRGFAQVSIELIARSAGVAIRTIYVHFGGKHGLLKRIIDCERERENVRADELWDAYQSYESTLREVSFNLLSGTLSPVFRNLYADATAARDFQLASTIDPMQHAPWYRLLERCFATTDWIERFGVGIETEMFCDLFWGCVLGAHSRALRATPGRVFGECELRTMADLMTLRFLALANAMTVGTQ